MTERQASQCTANPGAAVALACLTLSSVGHAATYYVARVGTDTNTCTQAQDPSTPRLTIAAGVACMIGGDTLLIKTGTYAETDITPPVGSPNSYTVLSSYQTDFVQIQSGAFKLFNSPAAYVQIVGFDVKGGIAIGQGPHHVRLWNLNIHDGSGSGISVGNDDLSGTGYIHIKNCRVHNGGTTVYDTAISLSSSADNVIENNEVNSYAGAAIQIWGAMCRTCSNNNIIRNNKIHHMGDQARTKIQGIVAGKGGDNQIYNNLVYDLPSTSAGLCCGAIQVTTDAVNTLIYNNTIFNISSEGINVDATAGVGTQIVNNISYLTTGSSIVDDLGGAVIDHNLTSDPMFVDAGNGDFHLRAVSPAIGAGVSLNVVTADLDGVPRPQGAAYDIGAYFYCAALKRPVATLHVIEIPCVFRSSYECS